LIKSSVSFGNQYDVKLTDLIDYFSSLETVAVISLYIEGLDPGEGNQFFHQAQAIRQPVIVRKIRGTAYLFKSGNQGTAYLFN